MKLTNEQIEQILNDAPDGNIGEQLFINEKLEYLLFFEDYYFEIINGKWSKCDFLPCYGLKSLNDLREILSLRKELEQAKKELEQVINEESDGVDGVV